MKGVANLLVFFSVAWLITVEGNRRILVVANDERTCYQLREVCMLVVIC